MGLRNKIERASQSRNAEVSSIEEVYVQREKRKRKLELIELGESKNKVRARLTKKLKV
jgi:hypothetical protein